MLIYDSFYVASYVDVSCVYAIITVIITVMTYERSKDSSYFMVSVLHPA